MIVYRLVAGNCATEQIEADPAPGEFLTDLHDADVCHPDTCLMKFAAATIGRREPRMPRKGFG
jgi:hypothetical protein